MRDLCANGSTSATGSTSLSSSNTPHMSFVLAEDATIDRSCSFVPHPGFTARPHSDRRKRSPKRDQSVGSSPSTTSTSEANWTKLPYNSISEPNNPYPFRGRSEAKADTETPTDPRPPPHATPPTPATPVTPATPPIMSAPSSILGSPSSRRGSISCSISEDQESLAILSALDSSGFEISIPGSDHDNHGSQEAPQLIMPTLSVPARRPFTEEGRSLARLKVVVAGSTGKSTSRLGKTSLIKSIVQTCQHIIHVDPTASPTRTEYQSPSVSRRSSSQLCSTIRPKPVTTEIFAGTKPYPSWWSTANQTDPSAKRRASSDHIIERNICLVDTVGYEYESAPESSRIVSQVAQYVEGHLDRISQMGLQDDDVLSLLSNSGGLLVDAVIYLIPSSGITSTDVQLLHRLQQVTNIIPVLARADSLQPEEIGQKKEQIHEQLSANGIQLFSFEQQETPVIFAVSNEFASDQDNMDASLLMSSEYIPPLADTDLQSLVGNVFSVDGSVQLRHATAKKFLKWRKEALSVYRTLEVSRRQAGQVSAPNSWDFSNRVSPFIRWNMFPKVDLVNWEANMQRSMQRERVLLEELAFRQREARGEVSSLALASARQSTKDRRTSYRSRRRANTDWPSVTQQDPLGLLEYRERWRWMGGHAVELLGSAGVVGGMAIWLLY